MPADAESPKKLRNNRAARTHKTAYALRHPGRVVPYLRRAGRDAWLSLKHPRHVGYYRAVTASDTRRTPEAAVGSRTHDRRPALGRTQFDHVARRHGLHARFMEDREKRPHGQSTIRVSRSPLPTA